MQNSKILCALDTGDLDDALATVRRTSPFVGGFKIGHGLTLAHGLDVVARLTEAGAKRIFLDLKFHDIPNSVAVAVREAAKRGVWMMTLHASGGSEMMRAAADEAAARGKEAPLLVAVSVLTSIEPEALQRELGVGKSLSEHAVALGRMAVANGMDGLVCSPHEIVEMRKAVGADALIVSPGIRILGGEVHDQKRTGSAEQALADGANFLVIGRALTEAPDLQQALAALGFGPEPVKA